jgi:hypothetical protein
MEQPPQQGDQAPGTGGDGKKSIEFFAQTENFRALCLFVVTSFTLPAYMLQLYLHFLCQDLSTAGMRALSDGEKLARYIHISKELRFTYGILFIFSAIPLVLPIAGAGAAFDAWFYLFLCPQGLNFLSSIVCQYHLIAVPAATRQITLKVTMRSQYTAIIVKILQILGVSTLLLARSAGHFVFTMVATSIDDGDAFWSGGAQCELNLVAIPPTAVVFAFYYLMQQISGVRLRSALEQMLCTRSHAKVIIVAVSVWLPQILNAAVVLSGADGPGTTRYCNFVAWGCFAPLLLAGCMWWLLGTMVFLHSVDQYIGCRWIRKLLTPILSSTVCRRPFAIFDLFC